MTVDPIRSLRRLLKLKEVERSGWVRRGVEQPESVSDHSWSTAVLCLAFAHEAEDISRDRAVSMALVHDLAEVETGDIPPGERTADHKHRDERVAMDTVTDAGRLLGDAIPLWIEYAAGLSPTARFVRDMNLVDMALQATVYAIESDRRELIQEFLGSAEARVQTEVGRRLLGLLRREQSASARGR